MGGEIAVDSEKGRGTVFTVSVELARAAQAEAAAKTAKQHDAPAASLEGLRVLIAEDMEINAEILMDLLEMEGVSTEWAENGQQAVEMFARSDAGRFSAILMDLRMPVMDGLTAAREIRRLDRPDAASVPIIALSANAFEEDVKTCLQAGMNAHLSKPVDVGQLKETLAAQCLK